MGHLWLLRGRQLRATYDTSLPGYVVASPTINTFKARLDKFWENQDVRYNWKADISFTSSRIKLS